MRLANIPFANAAPFFHNLDPAWLRRQQVVADAPKDLGDLARQDQVDAGLFSLVDVWDLEKRGLFEPLGNLGVAGYGKIGSILLFDVANPFSLEGQPIAVTGQTATTVKLMEIWLKEKIGLKSWKLVGLGQPAKGTLLIGDQAIARSLSLSSAEPTPIDLCQEWTLWTRQSFVFARWAVRKSLPEVEKAELLAAIRYSVDCSLTANGLKSLAQSLSKQTGFPEHFLCDYLSQIRYFFGDREYTGMALFHDKLADLG